MTIHTETLTTAWYELTDLDEQTFVMIQTTGDDIDLVLDVAEPDAAATSFVFVAGLWRIDIPEGKSVWVRCPSGTCDITYSKFSGIIMDRTKCAYAYTDAVTIDELVAGNTDLVVGDDDTGTDPISNVGFLHTVAAGINGAATVDAATLNIRLSRFTPGQVLRFYGVAENASQFSSLTDYASLASGLTLTTEFVDITVGYTGAESADITDLLQELVNVSGWSNTSPIQFWVGETTGTVTGVDYTATIFTGWKQTAVFASVS